MTALDTAEKNWIQTSTGRRFEPFNPDPDEIDIIDIAHALSNMCRYTGHVERLYSVAEHSVRVSRYVHDLTGANDLALWGLLHDASEAYLNDVARPVKRRPEFAGYREAEARLQSVIAKRFGLLPYEPDVVRAVDRSMLAIEAPRLFKGGTRDDWEFPATAVVLSAPDDQLGWDPLTARMRFLMQFRVLGGVS